MTRLRTAFAGSVVLPLVLTACAGGPSVSGEPGTPAFAVDVDVDTSRLRALKKDAGVEPCPQQTTPNGQEADGQEADGPATDGPPGRPPGGLPDIVLPCLGGGPDVNLSSLRGPMVVNLWAQWCGPCRDELPYYQKLHERAGDTVSVLGIDYQDTQPERALGLIRDTGVTFPLLADPAGQIRVPFRVRGLPGLLFVDEGGDVVHLEYTVIGSYAQLRDLVEEHLGVAV